MRGSEDGGNGGYVDGLVPLEAIGVVSRLERLNWRQVVDEAENRRVLHQESSKIQGYMSNSTTVETEQTQQGAKFPLSALISDTS
jgi:hypothetical protein